MGWNLTGPAIAGLGLVMELGRIFRFKRNIVPLLSRGLTTCVFLPTVYLGAYRPTRSFIRNLSTRDGTRDVDRGAGAECIRFRVSVK